MPCWADLTLAMRGYSFRKGHLKGVKTWDLAAYVGMSEKVVRDTYGHHAPDHLQEARDAI